MPPSHWGSPLAAHSTKTSKLFALCLSPIAAVISYCSDLKLKFQNNYWNFNLKFQKFPIWNFGSKLKFESSYLKFNIWIQNSKFKISGLKYGSSSLKIWNFRSTVSSAPSASPFSVVSSSDLIWVCLCQSREKDGGRGRKLRAGFLMFCPSPLLIILSRWRWWWLRFRRAAWHGQVGLVVGMCQRMVVVDECKQGRWYKGGLGF